MGSSAALGRRAMGGVGAMGTREREGDHVRIYGPVRIYALSHDEHMAQLARAMDERMAQLVRALHER